MKITLICSALILSLFLAHQIPAQTSGKKSVTAKKPVAVVTMTDLASKDVCTDPETHKIPVDGVVVKRNFADDEMTLIGVVIREKDDRRYFVNIDSDYVAGKGHYVPFELSSILTKGRRVKIWEPQGYSFGPEPSKHIKFPTEPSHSILKKLGIEQ